MPEPSKKPDLIAVLTADQRAELNRLVITATECMRDRLVATFDITNTPIPSNETPNGAAEATPKPDDHDDGDHLVNCDKLQAKLDHIDSLERRSNSKWGLSPSISPSSASPSPAAPSKKLLPEPTRLLHRAALRSFTKWQETVMQRLSEVTNTKAPAPLLESEPPPLPSSQDADADVEEINFLHRHYDGVSTTLSPALGPAVCQTLLLLLLSLNIYDARSRVLLLHVAAALFVPLHTIHALESSTAATLVASAEAMNTTDTAETVAASKTSKRWKVGLASLGGAVLIGVTGGLAAPFVAAGVGTILGGLGLGATAAAGLLGGLAGSSALVGALFGAYGGRMTGKMAARYAAEVEDFAFLPLFAEQAPPQLRVAIGATGWLTSDTDDEICAQWSSIASTTTTTTTIASYALRWEPSALRELGAALTALLTDAAYALVRRELLTRTIFATLYAALWPIAILHVGTRVLDNPFSVARVRADKAGRVLADALEARVQGERPVTLIGFGLGARVVQKCLLTLAQRRVFGVVENAVLLGTPTPAARNEWMAARAVVSGRVVNVFSGRDYVLAFLYRTSSLQGGVAGLQTIAVNGVESVDVSTLVTGHLEYRKQLAVLLARVLRGDVKEDITEQTAVPAEVEPKAVDGTELDGALARAEQRLEEVRQRNREKKERESQRS